MAHLQTSIPLTVTRNVKRLLVLEDEIVPEACLLNLTLPNDEGEWEPCEEDEEEDEEDEEDEDEKANRKEDAKEKEGKEDDAMDKARSASRRKLHARRRGGRRGGRKVRHPQAERAAVSLSNAGRDASPLSSSQSSFRELADVAGGMLPRTHATSVELPYGGADPAGESSAVQRASLARTFLDMGMSQRKVASVQRRLDIVFANRLTLRGCLSVDGVLWTYEKELFNRKFYHMAGPVPISTEVGVTLISEGRIAVG
ncbi:MAG: hypothetical protein EOO65_02080, partial [Methanosarcinales archaeon]